MLEFLLLLTTLFFIIGPIWLFIFVWSRLWGWVFNTRRHRARQARK